MKSPSSRREAAIYILLAMLFLPANQVIAGTLFGGESVSKYASHRSFQWQMAVAKHFTIYYQSKSATVPRLAEIKEALRPRERAF